MPWRFLVLFTLGVLAYLGVNLYIGIRVHEIMGEKWGKTHCQVFWAFLALVAMAYPGGILIRRLLPPALYISLLWVGSYWLGFLTYFALVIGGMDAARWLKGKTKRSPNHFSPENERIINYGIFFGVLALVAFGTWNAYTVRLRRYTVMISKPIEEGTFKVALVSDVHLNVVIDGIRFRRLVRILVDESPDLVVFVGDTLDSPPNIYRRQWSKSILMNLNPKYGIYAVLGNHEYYNGFIKEDIRQFDHGGIRLLRDKSTRLPNGVFLVGRDDRYRKYFRETRRKKLDCLFDGVDGRAPVILLDHQPSDPLKAEKLGVDLMLSGHTHNGQFFPFTLITRWLYPRVYGYYRYGNLQMIVTSGYGLLGPPLRIGSRPEVAIVTIQ